MNAPSNPPARKPTKLALDTELLAEAERLGIDLAKASEAGIAEAVSRRVAETWRVDNAEALAASIRYVERHGLPLAAQRLF